MLSGSYQDALDANFPASANYFAMLRGTGTLYGICLKVWLAEMALANAIDARLDFQSGKIVPVIAGESRIPKVRWRA